MSLPLDEILAVLRDHITDAATLNAVAKELVQTEADNKAARTTEKRTKTHLTVLIRGDAALKDAVAGGAWVVSVPDDDTTDTYSGDGLLNRLRKAVASYNEAPRKRRGKARTKIETWLQAFSFLKAKVIKDSGSLIGIKQKGQPCEVVVLEDEKVGGAS